MLVLEVVPGTLLSKLSARAIAAVPPLSASFSGEAGDPLH